MSHTKTQYLFQVLLFVNWSILQERYPLIKKKLVQRVRNNKFFIFIIFIYCLFNNRYYSYLLLSNVKIVSNTSKDS